MSLTSISRSLTNPCQRCSASTVNSAASVLENSLFRGGKVTTRGHGRKKSGDQCFTLCHNDLPSWAEYVIEVYRFWICHWLISVSISRRRPSCSPDVDEIRAAPPLRKAPRCHRSYLSKRKRRLIPARLLDCVWSRQLRRWLVFSRDRFGWEGSHNIAVHLSCKRRNDV